MISYFFYFMQACDSQLPSEEQSNASSVS
ncbi:hypothetical protein J005_04456 [Cryptococcus neoformans]|nr:hypothetical protein J005_04456 [Cryptococcus neoformans var. grubii]